jgi:phosphoribosylaminoimidazole-succinocarboxamide synthase
MSLVEPKPITRTEIPGLRLWRRGKVRDVYDLGDRLLIVATDRISAFDVVLPTAIPGKGAVLTQMSLFWFRLLSDVVANHVLTADVAEYGRELEPFRDQIEGRSMMVRKTEPFPVECVVRGYLAGSGWKDYRATGKVCGIALPPGLRESDRLPAPLFTPSTKSESGHDENIDFESMATTVGRRRAEELRELTLEIYARARTHAEERGIILADTKLEFGTEGGRVVWIDEALTPDSSRFWPRDAWTPGTAPPSFDKQFVRDYLETLRWDKRPPAPSLPEEVVRRTREKYLDAYARLTGSSPDVASPSAADRAGNVK